LGVFGSVIVVAFQSAFRLEMHQNGIFYFKKIIFDIKTIQKHKKKLRKKNEFS
jgi:hypothetical protein